MTWVDLVSNLSKVFNACFSSEEERLIWLRHNGWTVGVNDGIVWCRHPDNESDIFTPSGAVFYQAGLFANYLVDSSLLPIQSDDNKEKGLLS